MKSSWPMIHTNSLVSSMTHAPWRTKPNVRAAFLDVFERMPDAHWSGGTHRVIGDDYGVSEWTLTGTLADGGHVEVNGCDFLSFREGQIVLKNSYRKQRPALHITR